MSNHQGGYVNRETRRVNEAQTSSDSCSTGGVLGREGATDSAARRPIVKRRVKGKGKESVGFFAECFQGEICTMYVVPERNHAFPNPKHGVHSVLEIQAIDSDYIFGYRYPPKCLCCGIPMNQSYPAHRSKVRIKIQVQIEDVLLWSVIHPIRVGAETMLRLFIRFR